MRWLLPAGTHQQLCRLEHRRGGTPAQLRYVWHFVRVGLVHHTGQQPKNEFQPAFAPCARGPRQEQGLPQPDRDQVRGGFPQGAFVAQRRRVGRQGMLSILPRSALTGERRLFFPSADN